MAFGLRATLPKYLALKNLKSELNRFPLVAEGSDLGLRPLFKPKPNQKSVFLDFREVERATAEATVCSQALLSWMRNESANPGIRLETPGAELLEAQPTGRGEEHRKLIGSRLILNEAFQIPSLLGAYSVDDTSSASPTAALRASVERLTGEILARIGPYVGQYLVLDLISDFIWEALLNIQQHAYPSSLTSGSQTAWIVCRIYGVRSFVETFRVNSESRPEQDWIKSTALNSDAVIELAIADNGIGIPNSLERAFMLANAEFVSKLAEIRPGQRHQRIHDACLVWALSPYSTRKSHDEFPTKEYGEIWRGLYRILYNSNRAAAFLSLASGIGKIGSASSPEKLTRLAATDDFKVAISRPWPWTAISLRIPLANSSLKSVRRGNAEQISTISNPLQFDEVIYLDSPDRAIVIQPLDRSDSRSGQNEIALQTYLKSANDRIHKAIFVVPSDEAVAEFVKTERKLVALVHPATTFRSSEEIPSSGTTSHGGSPPEYRKALEHVIKKLILRNADPIVVPVHFMLGVDTDLINTVYDSIRIDNSVPGKSSRPFLAGVVVPGTNRVHWISSVPRQASAPSANHDGEIPTIWNEFSNYFPGVPISDHSSSVDIPVEISRLDLDEIALNVLRRLAKGEQGSRKAVPWYWEASVSREGKLRQAVKTNSNHFVSKYLSVFGLCEAEPVYFRLIARSLLATLRKFTLAENVILVPDTDTSSYILAQRLSDLWRATNGEFPEIVHPRNRSTFDFSGKDVLIFADVMFFGSSIKHVIADIESACTKGRGRPKRIEYFACLNLSSQKVALTFFEEELVPNYAISWSFTDAICTDITEEEKAKALRVDPISNELIPEELASEWNQFQYIVCNKLELGKIGDDIGRHLQPRSFQYGLQRLDHRYHLVRWSTRQFEPSNALFAIFSRIVAAASSQMLQEQSQGGDVVVFIRSSTSLRSVARAFVEAISTNIRTDGKFFLAEIETQIYQGKQLLRRGIELAIENAIPLADLTKGSRLFDESAGPSQGFLAIYLDNSAVSGRALREFVSSFSYGSGRAKPSAVLLCPVVSKLSPNQERFFRQVEGYSTQIKGPTTIDQDISGQATLKLRLLSLLQLRLRTYARLEHTAFFARLKLFVERGQPQCRGEIEGLFAELQKFMSRVSLEEFNSIIQCPFTCLLPEREQGNQDVSLEVISLRQLLALRQQGGPFSADILRIAREIVESNDISLLTVLALEPDLLDDDAIIRLLRKEIAGLCVRALETSESTSIDKANALWVIAQIPIEFEASVELIVRALKDDQALLRIWFALAQHHFPPAISQRIATRFLQHVTTVTSDSPLLHYVESIFRTDLIFSDVTLQDDNNSGPLTREEAIRFLTKFIRDSRFKHGISGFAQWQDIRLALTLDPPYGSVLDIEKNWNSEGIKELLKFSIFPALKALTRLNPGTRQKFRTSIESAVERFTKLDAYMSSKERLLENDEKVFSVFANHWNDLMESTFCYPWDDLVSQNSSLVLRTSARQAPVGLAPALLDSEIFAFTQDPLACLIHTLEWVLGENRTYNLKVAVTNFIHIQENYSSEDLRLVIQRMWQQCTCVPICWGVSNQVRTAFDIWAKNIRKYSDSDWPIHLTYEYVPDECIVKINITNRKNGLGNFGGHGTGIPKIRALAQSISPIRAAATFVDATDAENYSGTLAIPVSFIELTPTVE